MNERETAAANDPVDRDMLARRDQSLRRLALGALAGFALGLMLVVLLMRQVTYDPTPELTTGAFDSAYQRWLARQIADYDLQVRVTGPQPATYRVQVRSGEAVAAWRNDLPLQTRRTFGTWSVPGMFSTISRDLAALETAATDGRPPPLIVRASFHAEMGYPERYQRIDNGSRRGGDSTTVTWDVLNFRVVQNAVSGERSAGDSHRPVEPARP